ncbi:unnamed protein product [Rotaria sp. Silwood2]|nr:unnamed protein product [Rotaria sp. Silwood2]CAF4453471.1 unnamed protein product [Rotaria sp. Silwood2]
MFPSNQSVQLYYMEFLRCARCSHEFEYENPSYRPIYVLLRISICFYKYSPFPLSADYRIDQLYGYLRYSRFEERIGWLYNLQSCELFDEERRRFLSAFNLYFIGNKDDRFNIYITYTPYFYVGAKLERENDVYAYLSKRYHNRCLSCDLIGKGDLGTFIRLRFHDINDLMKVHKELQSIVKRNIEREKEQQSHPELVVLKRTTSSNLTSNLIVDGLSNANVADKQIDGIIELREFDVPYHIRVCIDLKINVGLWYGILDQSNSGPLNQLLLKLDLIEQLEPIIFAFDIECTKTPLKFPSAASDQINILKDYCFILTTSFQSLQLEGNKF